MLCLVLSHSVVSNSLWTQDRKTARLFCPWDSPGKNTGVGCHALLQGIFPTQGSNPGFPHCRQILYHLSHQGRPWILEQVAYPFSRWCSQPRNQTSVSWIAGRFRQSHWKQIVPKNRKMKIASNFFHEAAKVVPRLNKNSTRANIINQFTLEYHSQNSVHRISTVGFLSQTTHKN